MRLPSWSSPPPTRPAQNGIIAPRWCVMIFRLGWRSNSPEKARRAIAVDVSEGQPKAHQMSYFERLSPA